MENPTSAKGPRPSDDQYELAIRILAHFRDRSSARGVQWAQVTMPGRNLKSMQNLFTKINEDIKALGIEPASPEATSAPMPPSAKKRGRSSKTKKVSPNMMENEEGEGEEDDLNTPSKPPPKRKRAAKLETPSEETDDINQEVKQIDEDLIKSDLAPGDISEV